MIYLKTFEEIGTKMASKAINYDLDERKSELHKNAITSLFRDYIGKDIPFFVKTLSTGTPRKYKLIEVLFKIYDKTLELHFYNENGDKNNDAPYLDNKREIVFKYNLEKDDYEGTSSHYILNRYAVNLLINAANKILETFYTREENIMKNNDKFDKDKNDLKKHTKLTTNHFRLFVFDSKNMINDRN